MNQDTTDIDNELTRKHRTGAGINREKLIREVDTGPDNQGQGNNQSVQQGVQKNQNIALTGGQQRQTVTVPPLKEWIPEVPLGPSRNP